MASRLRAAVHVTGDLRDYAVEEILRDGGSIHIRAIRPDDRERLADHFQRLSARSIHFRFMGAKRHLSEAELDYFTRPDFVRHIALVATLRQGGAERIIGVGRYHVEDDSGAAAEVAFAVADAHQRRGIGTLLLEHLLRIGRGCGITEFRADVLGANNQMLEVFRHTGLRVTGATEAGVMHLSFPTAETEESRTAAEARERQAAAESVRALLAPRSVALVGASTHAGTIGAALLTNLRGAGFRGPIYPVHPKAREIQTLRAYPRIGAIGQPVDLAVIAVPAAAVEGVVEDCAAAGVRGVVVISSGFAEASDDGRAAQQRLTALVRGSGMRLVGPNCIGVLNTDPAVSLNATFAPTWPPAGNVGMLSQSGALGIAVLDHVRALDLGISTFVSIGNKADVSGNDLLCYWVDDPRTAVIVLYLESFGNPRRFARIAPEVARRKPIVAVKSGRSAAGTRAASSHSAALASLDIAVDALFEQAGVIRTSTLQELFDVAALLATQPVPAGPRVGVVTNAGGPGILLADACDAHGLALPELAPQTCAALRALLPPQASLANPIDLLASATPEAYAGSIELVGADPSVDALVVIYVPPMVTAPEEIAAAIARGAGTVPAEKPVLAVFLSSRGAPAALCTGRRGRLPAYPYPENAALALAAAERYGRWRRRPRGTVVELGRFEESAVRAVIDRVLAGGGEPRWLAPVDLAMVLRAAGIAFADGEQVAPDEAEAAAERLGFPLVAKAVAPGLLHKSDVGGVVLGLESPAAVAHAVATLRERMRAIGTPLEAVFLQREVRGGIEALVGVTTDATFGPLLVCGLGGVLVELVRDVAFRLPPVSDVDARAMLSRLRATRLLDGYRGMPPGDREALVTLIMRVSALVEVVPELRELDLNPVKVLEPGRGVIVVDARMRVGRPA
jgi:acetyl coenzyme A synthetase (ADP forming)-like protein